MPALECSTCDERTREKKNCYNRRGYKETLASKDEWNDWPEFLIKPVVKWDDLKFYECQLSVITHQTWEIIRLVNETTNTDGDVLHMPFEGAWTDQPSWYRQAVRITKRERSEHQRRELAKQQAKSKQGKHHGKR